MAYRKQKKKDIKQNENYKKRIIPYYTLNKIVKEMLKDKDVSFSKDAMNVLQEATEGYLVEIFESSSSIAEARNSTQISEQDFRLATNLINKLTNK